MTKITSKVFKGVESKSSRISSSSGHSEASGNHAVGSHQLNSIDVEKPTSNLDLDKDALQQATLKLLLEKREKLVISGISCTFVFRWSAAITTASGAEPCMCSINVLFSKMY